MVFFWWFFILKYWNEPEITNIFIPFWFKMSHSAMLMLNFSDSFKGQSWNGFLKKRELIAGNFKQQMTWPRNENYITKWSVGGKSRKLRDNNMNTKYSVF